MMKRKDLKFFADFSFFDWPDTRLVEFDSSFVKLLIYISKSCIKYDKQFSMKKDYLLLTMFKFTNEMFYPIFIQF